MWTTKARLRTCPGWRPPRGVDLLEGSDTGKEFYGVFFLSLPIDRAEGEIWFTVTGQGSERWGLEGLNQGGGWPCVPLQLDANNVEPGRCCRTVSVIFNGGVDAPLRYCSFVPFVFIRHDFSPEMR